MGVCALGHTDRAQPALGLFLVPAPGRNPTHPFAPPWPVLKAQCHCTDHETTGHTFHAEKHRHIEAAAACSKKGSQTRHAWQSVTCEQSEG